MVSAATNPLPAKVTEGCCPPGSTPGVAIFANNARYKREAYRGTPFAAKILASEGIEVAMKVRSVSGYQTVLLKTMTVLE